MEEFMDKETCVAFYEDAKVNARLSRIEARFERFVEANLKSGCDSVAYWDDIPVLWEMAEEVESFLESKRAEVKDGNV